MKLQTVVLVIAVLIILLAVIFVVTFLIVDKKSLKSQQIISPSPPLDSNGDSSILDSRLASFETNYQDGILIYRGVVQLPTPCHKLGEKTIVLESRPEQVRIDLRIVDPDPEVFCTQIIQPKEFSGEVRVSQEAIVSVYVNGEKAGSTKLRK